MFHAPSSSEDIETCPRVKVSSDRQEKHEIDIPTPGLVYKANLVIYICILFVKIYRTLIYGSKVIGAQNYNASSKLRPTLVKVTIFDSIFYR